MTPERARLVMKALGDPQRFHIFCQLLEAHELPARQLGQGHLSPSARSHHLRELTDAGVLWVTPKQQQRLYSINIETLRLLRRYFGECAMDATFAAMSAKLLEDTFET